MKEADKPKTLKKWQTLIAEIQRCYLKEKHEQEIAIQMQQALMPKWKLQPQFGKKGNRQDNIVPMDVDATTFTPLTEAEKKKLLAEGRCFRCQKQGHMSKQCPIKKGGGMTTGKPPPYQPKAGSSRINVAEEAEKPKTEEVKEMLLKMTKEKCDKMLNELLCELDF
jgi:Zinc knuckle